MALINCPECGKEVSDKASSCPNCGYPISIKEDYICKVNGTNVDLKFVFDVAINNNNISMEERAYILNKIKEITKLKYPERLYYKIGNEKKVPTEYNDKTIETIVQSSKPKCPHCQSTNIAKISGAERTMSVIGLGILSKKINKSFKCKSCGYTW